MYINQSYNVFDLLNNEADINLYPLAQDRQKGIINTAPFAGFILATGLIPDATYNYRPVPELIRKKVGKMQAACTQLGVKLTEAALSFCLSNNKVHSTIIGTSTPDHIQQWVNSLHHPLPQETLQTIRDAADNPNDWSGS